MLKVLINGGGISGLTLAYWLEHHGHRPVIVERSPRVRDVGYGLDFFGPGYDVAERMGLLPALEALHFPIQRLVFVDATGSRRASLDYAAFRQLLEWRHVAVLRGELERLLYATIMERVPLRFGTSIASLEQDERQVYVRLTDGTSEQCDVLVGADGVHSHIRQLAFGNEGRFEQFLGYYTAAFILDECLGPRDAWTAVMVPERQVGVYPLRGERTATFFLYKAHRVLERLGPEVARDELYATYGDLDWIVPTLLERAHDVPTLYFDTVSQVVLPGWSRGRVALVGDACGCVSLAAGQGASMAMAGAYILAKELTAGEDVLAALARYERRVRPVIERKQQAGRRFARWFVPDTPLRIAAQALSLRAASWRMLAPVIKRLFGWGRGLEL
jgi:2-polyprenyl-6-methoxyphenol hydroxylase-like FAD-dependent oxidoreductase